ncbi:5-deoxy-glucuronate isomerase [Micromonospora sp. KC723]|uniref:5-deoxy-glucuronate isomerase n=1 Tax=Micromonospora sp. KC723 TaxID=2530381 RepID=UPI0010492CD3|nr:5-deoxy-glucuronate isomerase [Micromonospora sp. KC723]TDB71776.1 5-deoxy-glucuronate isomerase [Micromonospora sp. KC723]
MTLEVTPESAGWGYSGLRVVELPSGGTFHWDTGEDEVVVVPLAGSATVTADGHRADLAGRDNVFAGPTDVAYVPRDSALTLTGTPGGRFALATARARRRLPFRHVPLAQVRVELRGAGSCSRQVNNFATPDVLEADRIIACEVLTPGGNWSSYPPHKHDEERPGESVLEEIYYYEVARGGVAFQRVYGTDERPIDILREVRGGDVVLIPHGWHGPSMAAPGYDLYYLNVMAGPGARSWLICDDPAHAWVRDTWVDQAVDPRLPFTPESPTAHGGER